MKESEFAVVVADVVHASGQTFPDLEKATKFATDQADRYKVDVLILQPVFRIAPKRDVVTTNLIVAAVVNPEPSHG